MMARYNPIYKKQPPKYNRPPMPPPYPSENQENEMKEPPKPMEMNEDMKGRLN